MQEKHSGIEFVIFVNWAMKHWPIGQRKCIFGGSLRVIDYHDNFDMDNISKDIKLEVKNTICLATELRQKETDEISKQADIMIVVGGKNSSNTTKLYEICLSNCKKVIHIEDEKEIELDEISKYNKVGIVAGSSTPKSSINNIINLLKNKEENLREKSGKR